MTSARRQYILEPAATNPWTCLDTARVFHAGGFQVRRDQVLRPDGTPSTYTFAEVASDFTVIVALDAAGRVALVRQWRYPWEASSWELPAGHLEAEEMALVAAQRELQEEAGLIAASWQQLATLRTSASLTAQSHIFLARDLSEAPMEREASEGDMVLRRLPLMAALAAAAAGDIVHAVSVSSLFLAQRALEAERGCGS
jgi:ADP-ribose pyrophosphatase